MKISYALALSLMNSGALASSMHWHEHEPIRTVKEKNGCMDKVFYGLSLIPQRVS